MKNIFIILFLFLTHTLSAQVEVTKSWQISLPDVWYYSMLQGENDNLYLLGNDNAILNGPYTAIRTRTAKIDTAGNVLWSNFFIDADLPFAFQQEEKMTFADSSLFVSCRQILDEEYGTRGVLLKKDALNGDIIWRKDYFTEFLGEYKHGSVSTIGTDSDGFVYLLEPKDSFSLNYHFIIEKLNPTTGETIWSLSYQDSTNFWGIYSATVLNDKIFITGYTASEKDFYLKINANGVQEACKFLNHQQGMFSFAVDSTENFYIYDKYYGKNKIVKVDPFNTSVDSLWAYSLTVPDDNTGYIVDIAVDDDLNIYAVGFIRTTPLTPINYYLTTKLDRNGNVIWQKTLYLGSTVHCIPRKIITNNSVICVYGNVNAANSQTVDHSNEVALFYDKYGNLIDTFINTITNYHLSPNALFCSNNNFYTIGESYNSATNSKNTILTQYKVNGTPVGTTAPQALKQLSVTPNPTNNIVTISNLTKPNAAYQISNDLGQVVQQGKMQSDNTISVAALAKGIYILNIEGHAPVKVVKE
ncbi:MAG: T9SS type A sorting domain-containing protein [Saprospiraceae bacterium]|nr:T9SS type A sorting domain-containing protein [Saprospiraceae bacterium]MBP7699894.1 T9SS type A sorting domain-containing protein [Saprospiraceae bacterium]